MYLDAQSKRYIVIAPKYLELSLRWLVLTLQVDLFTPVTAKELVNVVIHCLLLSTAPLTHLRILLENISTTDISVIADALPTLQHLIIASDGDKLGRTLAKGNPMAVDIQIQQGGKPIFYPHFTPPYVDHVFAPLAWLPSLQIFTFKFLDTKRGHSFTVFDLSQALRWRDKATPELEFIQIHHMTLTKTDDAVWKQGAAEHWGAWDPIADFITFKSVAASDSSSQLGLTHCFVPTFLMKPGVTLFL